MCLDFSLIKHSRGYSLTKNETFQFLWDSPYAQRHWDLSNTPENNFRFGHKFIAIIESTPGMIGNLFSLVELITVLAIQIILKKIHPVEPHSNPLAAKKIVFEHNATAEVKLSYPQGPATAPGVAASPAKAKAPEMPGLHSRPRPDINPILLKIAAQIDSGSPDLIELCKNIPPKIIAVFLKPMPEKRYINLFTYSLMKGTPEFSKCILDKIFEANLQGHLVQQRDRSGWTPVHHAALLNKDIYKRLKKIPEAAALKNLLVTSPSILRQITQQSKKSISNQNYRIYVRLPGNRDDSLVPSSEAIKNNDLFPTTPTHFSCHSHMLVKTFYELWENSNGTHINETVRRYNEYLKKLNSVEQNLALRPVESDDAGHLLEFKIGIGVFAKTDIKAGTVIGNYAGWVSKASDLKTPHTYRMAHTPGYETDGYYVRSFGSMINHSFPNVEYRGHFINGNNETLVIAISDIKEGDQLCGSYGEGYYSFNDNNVELRPQAMEQFVKAHPLTEFTELLKEQKTNGLTAPQNHIVGQWDYLLFDTPVRFIQLILRGAIPIEDAEELYDRFDEDALYDKYMKQFILRVPLDVLDLCIQFMKNTPQLGPDIAKRMINNGYTEQSFLKLIEEFDSQ